MKARSGGGLGATAGVVSRAQPDCPVPEGIGRSRDKDAAPGRDWYPRNGERPVPVIFDEKPQPCHVSHVPTWSRDNDGCTDDAQIVLRIHEGLKR